MCILVQSNLFRCEISSGNYYFCRLMEIGRMWVESKCYYGDGKLICSFLIVIFVLVYSSSWYFTSNSLR